MDEKIILFDVGGVIVNWKDEWLFKEIESRYKIPNDVLIKRFDLHRGALFTGKISEFDFWRIVLEGYFTRSENFEIIDQVFQERSSINEDILSLAKKLGNSHHRIGILSNITPQTRISLNEKKIFEFFKYKFFSDLIGFAKPDPNIFHFVKNNLNEPLTEILLIDDKIENIEAAKKSGFKTIHFDGALNLKSQISEFLD